MNRIPESILSNSLFQDQALSLDGLGRTESRAETGAFPQANGDVLLRLRVPGGESVRLHAEVSRTVYCEIELAKTEDGLFEGLLPYNEYMTGPANVRLWINGAEVLSPDLPVLWTNNRPQNFIEIPDPEGEYLLMRDVPHGQFIRETIRCSATGREERCMVYAPPEAGQNGEQLPVLYLLHGGSDNELMWEYTGRLSRILDNLWADGNAVRFLTVTMNGMLREGNRICMPVDKTFEQMLLDDCIPYIEKHYPVCKDREHRAIAGLSMGAYMSCDIGFGHPDLFSAIGTFTASMTSEPGMMTYERPYPAVLAAGAEAFARNYRLYWRSTTPQENHLDFFEADDRMLHEAGIDTLPCTHRVLYPPRTSKWNSWRMGLRDFAKLVFKEAE